MNNISVIQDSCVGCRSCEQVCPKGCIAIEENKEGFLYPKVANHECIKCGLCLKSCPVQNKSSHRNIPAEVWGFRDKNDIQIMRSASGGVACVAARLIIEKGGIVFGAAYDDQLVVRHIEIAEKNDVEKLQSSKYVQSDTGECFKKVKRYLKAGRKVLFTGTPCQIAGLYAFLGGDDLNLYTMDIICHGVPSPKFFKKYLDYQSKKLGEDVLFYNFRSKEKKDGVLSIL